MDNKNVTNGLFVWVANVEQFTYSANTRDRISGVLVWVLASDVVDSGFEARSGKTRDYKHGICCFCAKHTVLRSKRRDSMARNELYVFEWNDMLDCFIGLTL